MQELIKLLPQTARKSALLIRIKLFTDICKNYGDIELQLIKR